MAKSHPVGLLLLFLSVCPGCYLTFGRSALTTLSKQLVLRVKNVSVERFSKNDSVKVALVINPLEHFVLLLSTLFL